MQKESQLSRENNFGLLRLSLASLVILSHSPELIDGNRSRELLTRFFATVSFGGLAVDGFFIISGYLITQSWTQRRSPAEFAIKRLSRIVPGYAISFLICAMILAPFVGAGGAPFRLHELARLLAEMARLIAPDVPGAFNGLPVPALNGSMWTIAYEMRCYVFALLAGLLGLYGARSRLLYLLGIACLLAATAFGWPSRLPHIASSVIGDPTYMCRLVALFGSGAVYYLFRREIPLNVWGAGVAGVALLVALRFEPAVEPAIAVFGSYLIFWVAFVCPTTALSSRTNRTDISYGVYLYAFPIQNLLIWMFKIDNPWILSCLTFPLACGAGFLSWTFIEHPSLGVAKSWIAARRSARQPLTYAREASAS